MLNFEPEVLTEWQAICFEFGNGNCAAGYQFLRDSAAWLRVARAKHPVFGGFRCVKGEWDEVVEAYNTLCAAKSNATPAQVENQRHHLDAEMRDVMTTIVRFLNKEHGA